MKNFKEFVKEQNENILDEGIMDMLKGLGKGIVGAVKGIGKGGAIGARLIGKGAIGTAKGAGAIGGALAGGAKAGFRVIGGGGGGESGYNDGRGYDKGKKSGEKEGESAGLEKGRREAKEAGESASAANRGHNDTIRKFALSKGFDYDKEGGEHRFGVYTNTLRTRPDKVGHDSAGRPYNKKADGSQGGWFSGSTGNTSPHTDADWAEHEKSRDALKAAGTASGILKR